MPIWHNLEFQGNRISAKELSPSDGPADMSLGVFLIDGAFLGSTIPPRQEAEHKPRLPVSKQHLSWSLPNFSGCEVSSFVICVEWQAGDVVTWPWLWTWCEQLSQAPATVASLCDGLTVPWNCKPNRLSRSYFVFWLKCFISAIEEKLEHIARAICSNMREIHLSRP